ncbi:MAG: hypothetical protein WD595_05465 [Waddliaceae bacterium]
MQIQFTNEQYKSLVKAVYLGNWMVNANLDEENRETEYEELLDYLLSQADAFDAKDLVEQDSESNSLVLTEEVEELIESYKENYDQAAFWDSLIERLSFKELTEIHGIEGLQKMEGQEIFELMEKMADKYSTLLEEKGLDALHVEGSV